MSSHMLKDKTELLAHKIKQDLLLSNGQTIETASPEEFYHAFCRALREEVMTHWVATNQAIDRKKCRVAHFLSMEYLPGRLTEHNVMNIGASELVRAVTTKLGRDLSELYATEPDPGLGNGGLGRLASCFLDSLATLRYPAKAYGLRYQYGLFEQEIWAGTQVEKPDCWLLNENPWEQRRDLHAGAVHFAGKPVPAVNTHGDEVFLLENPEEVRALPFDIPVIGYSPTKPYSVLTLRLWSTKESPRNFQLQSFNAGLLDQAAENTALTDVLYPNDHHEMGKRIRLKQEFLLVSASLQDILRRHRMLYGDLSELADKVRIQINDTHPVLVIPELIRTLMKNHNFSWTAAREACMQMCSYTNHTILREALVEWNEERMKHLLPRQHKIIERLNGELCRGLQTRFHGDQEKVRRMAIIDQGQVKMAHLAIVGSHTVNGVAKLHSQILRERLFHEFAELYPKKFTNVTNGVTHRRWLLKINPKLAQFITERIGAGWVENFGEIRKLEKFAADKTSQEQFLAIKRENKQTLIDFLQKEDPVRDGQGKILAHRTPFGADALFDIQIKRMHEYKRQLMNALHLIMTMHELKQNPTKKRVPRLVLFGGKAAAGYERAKQIIQLISAISRTANKDPVISQHLRVIFVENYNVSKAELLIPAADLSQQISTAGLEASGTGNMKLSMNGALTIGTDDGANVEMRASVGDRWWPFAFGASAEENQRPYKPWDLYVGNETIRKTVDALKDGSLAETASDTAALNALHQNLVDSDPFRVLQDFASYAATQKKVEALFSNPLAWAETAIHNMAGMGPFSTDESIREYAKIWGIHSIAF